jgi:hypothetical protein
VCDSVQGVSEQAIRRKKTAASKRSLTLPSFLNGSTPAKKVRVLEDKLDDTALSSLPGLQAARAKLEDARAALRLEGGARTAKVMPPLLLKKQILLKSFGAVGG